MTLRAGLFTMVLGAAASACILAVSLPDAGGPHCGFAGGDTACGRCLKERCSAAVDGCCFEDQCGGVVSDLEGCTTLAGDACGRLVDPNDRGGAHRELSECVAKECTTACGIASKKNVTRCERAYVTSVEACRCEIGDDKLPNDTACTEIGHPRLRCCAPDGWPGPVRACECLRIICVAAGAGCLCQLTATDDQNRPTECTGAICCADPAESSCNCGTVPCANGEKQVAKCTIDALECGPGKRRVESCSVPR